MLQCRCEIEERASKSTSTAQKNGFLAEEKGIPAEAQGGAGPLLLGARVNTFATVTDVENYLPQPNAHAAHGRL